MASIQKRISKSGEESFRVRVRQKGFPVQCATFARKTEAKKWAQQTEAAIQQGRYFRTAESRRHTLAELIDRYISRILINRIGSSSSRKQQLLRWKSELGCYLLGDITPALISSIKEKLSLEKIQGDRLRSNASVNRYLAALSHTLTMAVNEWQWLEINPISKVSKLREPRGRDRYLSEEERESLLQACQQSNATYLMLIVVLALSTGMRRGEILNLSWSNVDLIRNRITLNKTKNGEKRVVPISSKALELLKEHSKIRRLDSSLLFPGEDPTQPVNCRPAWNYAVQKAKLHNFRFHDLRHSAASYLAMSGATSAEIAEILGHKTLSMVKRYTHLSDSHIENVVQKMNASIFG